MQVRSFTHRTLIVEIITHGLVKPETFSRIKARGFVETEPETRSGRRMILLPEKVLDVLAGLPERY
jgi:hypothetical protein